MNRKHCHKVLAYSYLAVVLILFLAPPVGTEHAIHALADEFTEQDDRIKNDCSDIDVEKEDTVQAEMITAAEADTEGNTEAGAEENTEAAVAYVPGIIFETFADTLGESLDMAADGIELMGGEELTAEEIAMQIKGPKSEEELFYESLNWGSIPKNLQVTYNPAFRMELPADQVKVLETIVEAEAGTEDTYGKMLVASVVLNRVLDSGFPDTVEEVVFQKSTKTYQFSPVRPGGRYYTVTVSEHTRAAVARVLEGEDYSEGALYFFERRYTSEKKANWFDTALRKIVKYGCHEFFGEK